MGALALLLGLIAVGFVAAGDGRSYHGPKLIEEQVRIPAAGGRYEIAATILRPEGAGPYGAMVLNHGVSASARERAEESSELLIGAASAGPAARWRRTRAAAPIPISARPSRPLPTTSWPPTTTRARYRTSTP